MVDGREAGRGEGGHTSRLILSIFQLIFVEGFSAAWLNKQQHANEWRMSVIIYQTKNGGLWEIAGRRKGGGREGRTGQRDIEIIWKIFVIKQLFKNLSPAYTPEGSFCQAYNTNA